MKRPTTRKETRAATDLVPWCAGVFSLPGVRIAGAVEAPRIALWVSRDGILAAEPALDADDAVLARSFATAVRASRRRPALVRVTNPAHAAAVRAAAGPDVRVEVGDAPELDAAYASLVAFAGFGPVSDAARDAALSFTRAPKETLAAFSRHAQALLATAPWTLVPSDADVLRVALGDGGARCVAITGQRGKSYAALVFESVAAYLAFRGAAVRDDGRPGDLGTSFLAISFDRLRNLDPDIADVLRRARVPTSSRGFAALAMASARDGSPAPLAPDTLAELAEVAEALADFFCFHARRLLRDPRGRIHHEVATTSAGSPRSVVIDYPHPEVSDAALEAASGGETDPVALFLRTWCPRFEARFAAECDDARREIAWARGGAKASASRVARDPLNRTSLPVHWAATSRPMRDGRAPLDLAEADPELRAGFAGAIATLRRQRALFGEVLHADAGRVVVRDLVDGARYELVDVDEAQRKRYLRWMYVFGPIVPRGDGRWAFPSLVAAQDRFTEDLLPTLLAALRREVRALGGEDATRDADDAAVLLRHLGIAAAIFSRLGDEARARPRRTFLENTDGERIEFVDATVKLPVPKARAAALLTTSPDFAFDGADAWTWVDRARTAHFPEGEGIGQVFYEKRAWHVTANSPARHARLCARLAEVFGGAVAELRREVAEPWRESPEFVATRGDEVDVRVIMSGPVHAASEREARQEADAMFEEFLWRSLGERVPAVGGVPRERVATEEGCAAVERWLRSAEARGRPKGRAVLFFDADPLRRELGIPTVG